MRIRRPHAIQNIDQLPGLDLVLQEMYNNLRSEKWEPPEIAAWGSSPTNYTGRYQLIGQICFLLLSVSLSDVYMSGTSTNLTLPVQAYPGGDKVLSYPLTIPGQIVLYDITASTVVGNCLVHPTNWRKLTIPAYSPASGVRQLTLSGYYWVE